MTNLAKKCSSEQIFILKGITSYKIHTLVYRELHDLFNSVMDPAIICYSILCSITRNQEGLV